MRPGPRHDAFDIITNDSAYWLGFIFADGSVDRTRPRLTVKLTASDREHLVKLRSFLGTANTIGYEAPRNKNGYASRASCRLSLSSVPLTQRILSAGRYKGPIAPELASSRDFWRGVVDGDGSLGRLTDGRPYFGLVGSLRVLEAFHGFLAARDLAARMTIRPTKTIYMIATTGRVAAPIIELMYGDAGTVLARKGVLALPVIEEVRRSRAGIALAATDLRTRYESGTTLAELGRYYGVSDVTILRWMKKAGISRRPAAGGKKAGHVTYRIDLNQVCAWYESGESVDDIALRLGMSPSTIRYRAQAVGIELRFKKIRHMAPPWAGSGPGEAA